MELTRVVISALSLLVAFGLSSAKVEEENPEFWRSQAQKTLQSVLDRKLNTNVAKNILFFLGDVQTYSVDFQIPDSAATATAYLCGVKTNLNTIGVSAAARNGVCKTQKGNEVTSILKWAKDAGKSVGIVTTTRVQHATPAASYAHSASRKWYSDADMPDAAKMDGCTDIASQLLKNTDIDVIIGGGRKYMTPKGTKDPEYPKDYSSRAHYVWNRTDFSAVDPETTDYLMALFEPGDLHFETERDPNMDPSIVETTEKAIRILQKNPKGFFLLVEGGRIDQAHHSGRAYMALHETVAFDYAIAKGLELTKEHETLTIVMADHSHSVTFNGYPFRGQSILGKSPLWATDVLPYTTLMYGNGPGHKITNGKRPDIRDVNTMLARGPMAHLFQGVQEQNYIAHAMAYAACVGADIRHCQGQTVNEAPAVHITFTNNNNGVGAIYGLPALLSSFLCILLAHIVLM
ncbi:hypothetical protein FQN60_004572 [Etheostoma spectabile]|uniref:Alkaline phosphatase n=1 Tax=Etheostoma spectabile TaxID=54343 RepID=A0A5J5DKE7_9PERO|nr:hypothetical protein FQN60_004572 [Etheostoma spectabile]